MPDGIKVEIKGLDRVKKRIARIPGELEKAMRDEMAAAAELVKADVLRSMHEPKSGIWYFRGRRGRKIRYQASAPGEAPAYATGTLAKAIVIKKQNRPLKPSTRVVAAVPFSKKLEVGTALTAARPAFQPALERNRKKIAENVKQRTREVIKRGRG